MNLNAFMESGIRAIASSVTRYYLCSPQGRSFLGKFLPALYRGTNRRKEEEEGGLHIPPFLIASITTRCNLHCAGCYARAEGMCGDQAGAKPLSAQAWSTIFLEAEALGISFILLAGGEPLLRKDILEEAAKIPGIIFPVFTNGTLLTLEEIAWFSEHRNLVPVLSLEGDAQRTDQRRGEGIAAQLDGAMERMGSQQILYAVSITVTRENWEEVTGDAFVAMLREKGCGVVFYVEYVPVQAGTENLVLTPEEAAILMERTIALKGKWRDTVIVSFPGDEARMGGCLAAGRGFFHINPTGGMEPCPFSPYACGNVQELGVRGALASEFFRKVQEVSGAEEEHVGGCTLFRHEGEIAALLQAQQGNG